MGDNNVVVDTDGLARMANELRQSSGAVKGSLKNLTDNLFGVGQNGKEPQAGRKYVEQGKKVHDGLENIGKRLQEWSTAASALADAFGKSSIAYATTDTNNAKETDKTTQTVK